MTWTLLGLGICAVLMGVNVYAAYHQDNPFWDGFLHWWELFRRKG